MSNILFNNQGVPLIGYGTKHFIETTGVPAGKKNAAKPGEKTKSISIPMDDDPDKTLTQDVYIANWGASNNFPDTAIASIESVGVLNTGLRFIRNFTMGQGIYPVRVTGYDNQGNETLEMVPDQKIRQFVNNRIVRRYLEKTLRDYLKFGVSFVQLLPNSAGEMVGINTINARYCRLTVANTKGVIEKCIVSGKWPDTPTDKADIQVFDVLDEYDPYSDLRDRRIGKAVKSPLVYVVRDSWSNNEYYSTPIWYTAYTAGWVDIAKQIPEFLKTAYHNQITWKWHVQIPYAFWDKKYPESQFKNNKERQDAIQAFMDQVEDNLCGTTNANKPIFTFFEINPNNGKVEEQWIIKPLENKLNNDQNLITSAAANSEILFALMINPNVMGAGMPGGTYSGNQGGSNIREAFLVNIANAWIDRQNILDPLEAYLRFNGVPEDVELRFRNTILTTLDTGAGTQKTLS